MSKNRKRIIGVKGNNDLNKFLLKGINTELDNEITKITFNGKNWKIIGKRRDYYALQEFNYLFIPKRRR